MRAHTLRCIGTCLTSRVKIHASESSLVGEHLKTHNLWLLKRPNFELLMGMEMFGQAHGNKKARPVPGRAFFFGVKPVYLRLSGVKFNNELFVDDRIDFLACGNADDAAAEVVFINQKPIRDVHDLSEFDPTFG